MRKTSGTLFIHLCTWCGLYLFWIFIFRNHTLTLSRTLTVEFCYLVFIAGAFYTITSLLAPRFLHRKKILLFGATALLTISAAAFLRAVTAMLISRHFFPGASTALPALFLNSFLTIFFWTNLLVGVWIVADRMHSQRQLAVLERERMESELKFLRAQNNPHFLFNSLNLIYFQIDRNNSAARETLMKFSEILRYQLYDCGNDLIPVEKELHYLHNYISLQKLRMSDNYKVVVTGSDTISGFSIAPLLILPLVENAFKHASGQPDRIHEITIGFSHAADEFRFQVSNPKQSPFKLVEEENAHGIGLENVQRRLALLYPERHRLEIKDNDDFFSISLVLQTA